jgi:hypothetical protein
MALELLRVPETRENRFELWFSKGRFPRLALILALLLAWLLCDSVLAVVIVMSGHGNRDEFYATSRWFARADDRDIPELSGLLARHARIYSRYLDHFQADGLLGGRLAPNFLIIMPPLRRKESDLNKEAEKHYWFMTDEQGFPPVARMGHHYLVQKPADVFRVIMLGGSTVEGLGVNSPLQSLPSKLQLLLEREFSQSSKQVEVINGGISGFTSDLEYLKLLTDFLPYEPDLVIAYDGWNDSHLLHDTIAGAPRTRPYRTASQENNGDRVNASFSPSGSFGQFATITAGRILESLSHFATFRLVRYSVSRITGGSYARRDYATQHYAAFDREPSVEAAQFYVENRERMLFIAKQKGFRFASFLQPIIGIDGKSYSATEKEYAAHLHPQIASDVIRQEREVFYQTVRPLLEKLASANEVPGASCVADISSSSFAGVSDTVYADPGHLLANGNELVAQRILAELKRCKLLPL